MTVSFDIPADVERLLRDELGDLATAAREALLVECYRRGALSMGRLAELLRLAATQVPTWLASRGVPLNYSREDAQDDAVVLRRLFGEGVA